MKQKWCWNILGKGIILEVCWDHGEVHIKSLTFILNIYKYIILTEQILKPLLKMYALLELSMEVWVKGGNMKPTKSEHL